MPNIDPSTIEGFENMSDAEKVTALLGLDIPERVDLSGYVKKDVFDKTSSELASAKKSLREKMTAEETAKAQQDEAMTTLQAKYNDLLKKSTVAEHTAKYLALGYSAELAQSTAEAIFDGDMDTVLENQKKYNAEVERKHKEEAERGMHPGGGSHPGGADPTEELAKKLGKRASEADQTNRKTLEHYFKI